jgi:hypothetical protein
MSNTPTDTPPLASSFEVWVKGKPEWKRTVNARSRGKAKSAYHRDLSESWDIDYRLIRCRSLGKPQTSEAFKANALYRGMPGIECGQRVKVGDSLGVIVGHNASANFNVLFDDNAPFYPGLTLNVHPHGMELIA